MSHVDLEASILDEKITFLSNVLKSLYKKSYQCEDVEFKEYKSLVDGGQISEQLFIDRNLEVFVNSFTIKAEDIGYIEDESIFTLAVALRLARDHNLANQREHAWHQIHIASFAAGRAYQIGQYRDLDELQKQRTENSTNAANSRHKDDQELKQRILDTLEARKPPEGWASFKHAIKAIKPDIENIVKEHQVTGVSAGRRLSLTVDTIEARFSKWRHSDQDFKLCSNQFVKKARKQPAPKPMTQKARDEGIRYAEMAIRNLTLNQPE